MDPYAESLEDSERFWARVAQEHVTFYEPWDHVVEGSLEGGDVHWFTNAKLNVAFNCLDRHLNTKQDQVALIWEGDDPNAGRWITYREATREVSRLANVLVRFGIGKGDRVAIFLPTLPEAVYAMLACARIGAPHLMVFSGSSPNVLRSQIVDAQCKAVITADESVQGQKITRLKAVCDEAIRGCSFVGRVFVHRNTHGMVDFHKGRDVWLAEEMREASPYCPCEVMDAEDPLFLMYTAGSTGNPKGIVHTHAGYLVCASLTHKHVFGGQPGDVHAFTSDISSVTGHSSAVYGSLCNGGTTVMLASTPTFPDAGRYWDLVERHKVTMFSTSPTSIRTLMQYDKSFVSKHNRSSLRVLSFEGEPLDHESWTWYHDVVGEKRCSLVDTYWQSETGGIIAASPRDVPSRTGLRPLFGIHPVIMDLETDRPLEGNNVYGVLCIGHAWPSLCRTLFGRHDLYRKTYFAPFPGHYLTSDACTRDADGLLWITGRVDDVICIAGTRFNAAEVEGALLSHPACVEAAVVGCPHATKGQTVIAFCILKSEWASTDVEYTMEELKATVRKLVGSLAVPDRIIPTLTLPKTRSGQIIRRILRRIAARETDPAQIGDTSILEDASVVEELVRAVSTLP